MMNWKRFIIIISSVLAITAAVKYVIACSDPGSPYDSYVTFFQNNITAKPQYEPFYFTDQLTYYDQGYFDEVPADDTMADANTEEWYAYAKQSVKKSDIDSFMTKFNAEDVSKISEDINATRPALKENTFCQWLSKNKDALKYMLYAKQCEPLVMGQEEYYDNATHSWRTPSRDTVSLQPLIQQGVKMQGKTKDDFLAWRYRYQAIRLAFYNAEYEQTLDLYDELIGKKTADNIMYPRCLGLKAGVLYRTGKKQEAAYLYTKVFDLSDDMKRKAYISFNWSIDSVSAQSILPLCKTDHEKAVVYIMDGLYENSGQEFEGLDLMQKAYDLDPNVKGLDIVMTRDINKMEERYYEKVLVINSKLGNGLYYYPLNYYISDDDRKSWNSTKTAYQAYLDKLNNFSKKVAADSKTTNKAFWYLSTAYIYYLQQNIDDCKKYMALAENEHMTTAQKDVHDIMAMLCVINYNSQLSAQTESSILPSLEWIEKRTKGNERFQKMYRDVLSSVLANRYLFQGDTVKAVYCLARVNKTENNTYSVDNSFGDLPGSLLENMSIAKLHELQAFVKKSDKTPFEKWLTTATPYSADVLKELEGTKYIRELQFDKAVAVLSNIGAANLPNVLADFLVSHIQDSQDLNASDTANMYNKLQFAKKMLELQQQLAANPKDSRTAYQYANALYSMSYYGKSHDAYDYYRSSSDDNAYYATPERKKMPLGKQEYYNVAIARKYYLQAFANTTNAEEKARYIFMAAKCWQKSCPMPEEAKNKYEVDDILYYHNSLKNPDFQTLLQYKKTKFFDNAVNTCSYLRDYVGKH